jgi:hypothetical protein
MITKIRSGGQTGVDRGALDFAIKKGIPHGGFCPKGRRSESGRISDKYNLVETSSPDYPDRTQKNVAHSDGTLIISRGSPSGGTKLTEQIAIRYNKPRFVVNLKRPLDAEKFVAWVCEHNISEVNVAGPRESKQSGIQKQTVKVMAILWEALEKTHQQQ